MDLRGVCLGGAGDMMLISMVGRTREGTPPRTRVQVV